MGANEKHAATYHTADRISHEGRAVMSELKAPRCRKCGCYKKVHDPAYNPWPDESPAHAQFEPLTHRFSRATRVELWFLDHESIWTHVKAWAWLNLRTSRGRMNYVERYWTRHPEVCRCSLIDSWWHAEPLFRSDYRKPNGCVCHFPMPRYAGAPPEGGCYCTPAIEGGDADA